MAGRKSQRSRRKRDDTRRFGLSRPRRIRSTLPVIVVVCDDARTAVSYFLALKREVRHVLTLTVEGNPCDRASPAEVLKAAKARLAALRRPKCKDGADQSSVWALIDLESDPARRSAASAAKTAGKRAGVSVALSDPCYEVWTLLHLEDTGSTFGDCKAVLDRVKQKWKAKFGQDLGNKAQADYSKIVGSRVAAAARAKKHHTRNDPAWTEVYLLVEEIELCCAAAASSDQTT